MSNEHANDHEDVNEGDNEDVIEGLSLDHVIGFVFFAIVAIGACYGLYGLWDVITSKLATSPLYNCERHTVRQCTTTYVGLFGPKLTSLNCLYTNNSQVQTNPNDLSVWSYDAGGVLLDTNRVRSPAKVPAGGTVHIELWTRGDGNKNVICSMDPNSPIIGRDTWTRVGS